MNAEDVEDEVADDEQPSGSSRADQNLIHESHSLVGRSSAIYNCLLTIMQVVRRLKLYVLLKINFNLLEISANFVLLNAKSLAGEQDVL